MLELISYWTAIFSVAMFAQMPSTSNYQLNSFGFGSGGVSNASTPNYALQGISGEVGSSTNSTATYKAESGTAATQQANVPGAPTLENPANFYNKLKITLNTANNPSDALFAIAISDDNFVTTEYVQNDNTVGASLGIEDYQTYAGWGGASGTNIIGLSPSTTYKVKAKATRGKFTESQFGPEASASTVSSSLTFALSTTSQSSPPFSINIGSLLPGTVVTAADKLIIDISANGETGSNVYIKSQNGGLSSISGSYSINSASSDLASAGEGYGMQSSSANQTSGGPLTAQAPFNLSGHNVGILGATFVPVYRSTTPIVGGHGEAFLKAKASTSTPSANDFGDILTIVAAANY